MIASKTLSPDDIITVFSRLDPSEIDNLAFGAIQLNAEGTILAYNAAEAEITGRNAKDVIGKNFFKDVAPCTRTPTFQGKFKDGVKLGKLSVAFDYVFDGGMKPTEVRVYMKKALVGDTYWIFVKRLSKKLPAE